MTTTFTFTGARPAASAASIALEHAGHREVDVVHRAEDLVVERVEADGDPVEARGLQRLGLAGEEGAVRRQRQVEPVDPGEERDQRLEVAAHERLAAGDPQLLDAEAGEGARETLDLLERQQVGAGEEGVVAAEDLLRHAVDAAEVAPVRHGDPEVPHRPPQLVGQPLHG